MQVCPTTTVFTASWIQAVCSRFHTTLDILPTTTCVSLPELWVDFFLTMPTESKPLVAQLMLCSSNIRWTSSSLHCFQLLTQKCTELQKRVLEFRMLNAHVDRTPQRIPSAFLTGYKCTPIWEILEFNPTYMKLRFLHPWETPAVTPDLETKNN